MISYGQRIILFFNNIIGVKTVANTNPFTHHSNNKIIYIDTIGTKVKKAGKVYYLEHSPGFNIDSSAPLLDTIH